MIDHPFIYLLIYFIFLLEPLFSEYIYFTIHNEKKKKKKKIVCAPIH
jgi:hypothetical protein